MGFFSDLVSNRMTPEKMIRKIEDLFYSRKMKRIRSHPKDNILHVAERELSEVEMCKFINISWKYDTLS